MLKRSYLFARHSRNSDQTWEDASRRALPLSDTTEGPRCGGRCKTRYSDQSNNEERINMSVRIVSICAVALAGVLFASTATLAGGERASGTITAVEEEIVKVKGDNGKEYEIAVEDIVVEDLKTGDIVEG